MITPDPVRTAAEAIQKMLWHRHGTELYLSELTPLIRAACAEQTAELERMQKENTKLSLLERYVHNLPFCPDHRDKVSCKPCRECEVERQTAELERLRVENEKLRERLHYQTQGTLTIGNRIREAVVEKLREHDAIPEGIDPYGHPTEQTVGTCLWYMDGKLERLQALLRSLAEHAEKMEEQLYRDCEEWSPSQLVCEAAEAGRKPC